MNVSMLVPVGDDVRSGLPLLTLHAARDLQLLLVILSPKNSLKNTALPATTDGIMILCECLFVRFSRNDFNTSSLCSRLEQMGNFR